MKKKKILLIYYVLFNPGGVARVMTNLANELVEQGHEVEILLLTSKTEAFYSFIIGKTKCAKNFRYGFQFLAGKNRSKITKFKHSLKKI